MFDDGSRYKDEESYTVPDPRGREVNVVRVPDARVEELHGHHRRVTGQRLDHLSARYLGDPTAFWRICELAGVLHPQTLLRPAAADPEALLVPIPRNG